jgi:UDP-arabinose 4-epimerase
MMALQGYIDDFQVFGSDFPTPDGTAIRDYIHVLDLAGAHVLALKYLQGGNPSSIFNLGIGQGYSVGEILTKINEITGRNLPAPRGDRRPGDPAQLVADASRAREILGFNPVHSDLETIIGSAWNWHLKTHPLKNSIGVAVEG